MTHSLNLVVAPHEPNDAAKLASLVAAYAAEEEVPPVRIIVPRRRER